MLSTVEAIPSGKNRNTTIMLNHIVYTVEVKITGIFSPEINKEQ